MAYTWPTIDYCDLVYLSFDISEMASNYDSFNENSSEESDESFYESFMPYDESLKPVANEEEAAQYRVEKAREDEEARL